MSTRGLDIAADEYDAHVVEEHVGHSTALHAHLLERGEYLVGPMARYALNASQLAPEALDAAAAAGLAPDERNPFRSIVVRAVEIVHACAEALRVIDAYDQPDHPAVTVEPRAGVGCGWTEAPRGTLWHRYELAADGTIIDARIVPPTSQNQPAIEHDLFHFVEANVGTRRHRVASPMRTGDPQLRPMHLVRDALPRHASGTHMSGVVVIGVGNRYRRDDGAGPAVLDALATGTTAPRARLVELDGEPARVVDAWAGADLAIVVDARSLRRAPRPARYAAIEVGDDVGVLGDSSRAAGGSHAFGIGTAAALGRALGRMPVRLVVFAVEGRDFGHGEELSQPVRRAVTDVTARIAAEIAGSG